MANVAETTEAPAMAPLFHGCAEPPLTPAPLPQAGEGARAVRIDRKTSNAVMKVDLFDFELPEDRIALRPAQPRDAARMLVVRPKQVFEDRSVCDLPELLRPGDALVLNDTKVIPSRLF